MKQNQFSRGGQWGSAWMGIATSSIVYSCRLAILLLPLLLAGCVTSQSIVTGTRRAPVAPEQVRVYSASPAGAEEIALVNVDAQGNNQRVMDRAVAELKTKAGALGANGIVILTAGTIQHTTGSIGDFSSATGLFFTRNQTIHNTKVSAKALYVKEGN